MTEDAELRALIAEARALTSAVGDRGALMGSMLAGRGDFLADLNTTYNGNRDQYKTFGYRPILNPANYRVRFLRDGMARRLVTIMPNACWRSGGEVIEDEDPDVTTPFEQAWDDLNTRLKLWSRFKQADIMAGLGHYAILMLGAPGDPRTPLTKCSADNLAFVRPFAEQYVIPLNWVDDTTSPRHGQPDAYQITLLDPTGRPLGTTREVHYTRCIHVAEDLLDDDIFGTPRLEAHWNRLDDLEKIAGGGAEAFYRRADAGMHVNIDPAMQPDAAALDDLKSQLKDYVDKVKRMLVTRGTDITMLQGGVADIKGPIDAIVSLICAGAEIPQRILMGSERGELASTQDKDEFWGRVSDRRADFCNPIIATALVTRLIEIGALPEPKSFDVRWPDASKLDDSQLAAMATQWASLNSTTGKTVVTIGEIRELIGLPPLEEVDPQAADANEQLAQAKLDLALAMPAQVGQSGSPASKPPDKKKQAPPEKTSKLTAAEFFKLPKPVRKFLVLSGEGRKAYMDRKMAVGE